VATILILIVVLLVVVLVMREPELRRRLTAGFLRGQGSVRAALGLFQPRDLQRQALAQVKDQALVSIGYAHLPTDVVVLVSPADFKRLGATHAHVASELADQISALEGDDAGGGTQFVLGGRPQVTLQEDGSVARGTVEVEAIWLEGTILATAMPEESHEDDRGDGPHLLVEVKGEAPWRLPLAGRTEIGRDPSSTVPINHPGVSRRHAVLAPEGRDGWTIVDLDSSNQVRIDGNIIQPGAPAAVAPGQSIQLSKDVRIELVADGTWSDEATVDRQGLAD